jgi:hypothetical protein
MVGRVIHYAGMASRDVTVVSIHTRPEGRVIPAAHPYLKERGFTPERIVHFDVGYHGGGA